MGWKIDTLCRRPGSRYLQVSTEKTTFPLVTLDISRTIEPLICDKVLYSFAKFQIKKRKAYEIKKNQH